MAGQRPKRHHRLGSFKGLRILVIHSGGDSKRVPSYSALGKLFSPVPHKLPNGKSFAESFKTISGQILELPIDNLQFIDPILNFSQEFKKSFYLAGVRHYLGCNGDNCCEAVKIVPGEEIKFVWEADNLYDKNAVQVYDQREKLIGYVPRYYAEAFAAFIKEKRVKKGKILCVDKNRNCDECIKIEVSVAGV